MGKLLDALSPPSAYRAKKTDFWETVTDRIAGAILAADLDDLEHWLVLHVLDYPETWNEPIAELIEKRREELAQEDVNQIVRDKYDFT